jgi:hypothetical protein
MLTLVWGFLLLGLEVSEKYCRGIQPVSSNERRLKLGRKSVGLQPSVVAEKLSNCLVSEFFTFS